MYYKTIQLSSDLVPIFPWTRRMMVLEHCQFKGSSLQEPFVGALVLHLSSMIIATTGLFLIPYLHRGVCVFFFHYDDVNEKCIMR